MDTYSLPTLLIAVITMVVGSMPEGLPASTSVVLAMGTRQMTKKNVIVKSLPAVETLGAVDIVNTDKTGTLTKNEMTVTKVVTPEHTFDVTGSVMMIMVALTSMAISSSMATKSTGTKITRWNGSLRLPAKRPTPSYTSKTIAGN